jgi:8-oxo-dGTP pyrophosphatase MutT (NUDIX family)
MKNGAPYLNSARSLVEPEAAVAIIRCPVPRESILLLRRIQSERDPWSGHYALPGGRRERQDETIYDTCVREVFEETGIDLGPDNLLQILPQARAGRNVKAPVLVQPYVFEIDFRPEVVVEEKEIETYLWLSAVSFTEARKHRCVEVLPGMMRPVFPLNEYYVWGFTYGLLCAYFGFEPPGHR